MLSRVPALLVYILVATVAIAQVAIRFGAVTLFWLGVWGLSVLIAFAVGAFLGIRKGRDEYRHWR